MRYDKVFGAALIGEEGKLNLNILKYNVYYFHIIEKVLFSCNVKLKTPWRHMFPKERKFVITDRQIV